MSKKYMFLFDSIEIKKYVESHMPNFYNESDIFVKYKYNNDQLYMCKIKPENNEYLSFRALRILNAGFSIWFKF